MGIPRKTGSELFHESGARFFQDSLLSYWQWSASDLLANTQRGVLAEYLVALALGVAAGTRAPWDAYDLETSDGLRIEVKSTAYLQSWDQKKPSAPRFGVRRTHAWNSAANGFTAERKRQADVYVFAILTTKERCRIDPMDVDQWDFYVLPTQTLDRECRSQKTIGLTTLVAIGAAKTTWRELARTIDRLAESRR